VVTDWESEQLAWLRPRYPRWDIWTVRIATARQTVWCARPVGHPVATINTDSPERMVEEIRHQEQEALRRPE
jgi:hypothetical protein